MRSWLPSLQSIVLGLILASVAGGVSGCAPTPEDRVRSAIQIVDRTHLISHLEMYGDAADNLWLVREFFEGLGDVAAVCKGITSVLGDDTLNWVLSKVTLARVAWELVDDLEFVQRFWSYLNEMRGFAYTLRTALLDARDDPSKQNLERLSTLAASGAQRLLDACKILEWLEEWLLKADLALGKARREIRQFERDADFIGVSLVAEGIEKMVDLVEDELLGPTRHELSKLSKQLRSDVNALIEVAETTSPARANSGCSCRMGRKQEQ